MIRSSRARSHLILVTVLLAVLGAMLMPSLALGSTPEEPDVSFATQPAGAEGPDGRERFDYAVAPGSSISDWVALTNHSAATVEFRVYAADATTDYDTGAFTLIGSNASSTDLGGWTSLDGAPSTCLDETPEQQEACRTSVGVVVTLQPGARATIPFTVTVPHEAAPGDHAAGIIAVVTERGADGGTGVNREIRSGTRIYLRVDGPLNPGVEVSGLVSGFDTGWIPFGPGAGRVGLDVSNTGNTRLTAETSVHLTGPFGIDLGQWEVPAVQNLLPGGTAHVVGEFPGTWPLLLLNAEVTVVPELGDGLADDQVPPRYTRTTTAWAIPWTGLALLILVGGIVALIRWRRRRRVTLLAEDLAAYREHILAEAQADHATDERPEYDRSEGNRVP